MISPLRPISGMSKDKPLKIAFHGVASSREIEAEIRDHVEKLERRFGHLTQLEQLPRVAIQ